MKISGIVAGVMNWGAWGKCLDEKAMSRLIEKCVDVGIDTFDHADIYGGYSTEAAFGMALHKTEVNRSSIKIITKCGIILSPYRNNYDINHYNYTSDYIIQQCEQSLRNLKTDYIDLFLLHRPSPLMQPEEIAHSITGLLESGKIKSFGVSNFTVPQMQLIIKYIPVTYNQIEFSATKYAPMVDGTTDFCMIQNIGLLAWGPLGKVFNNTTDQALRIREQAEILAIKYRVPEEAILIHWIMQHPAGISPVVGTTNDEHLEKITLAQTICMSDEDWFKIWVASMGHPVP